MSQIKRQSKKLSGRQMNVIGIEYLKLLEKEYLRRQRRKRIVAGVLLALIAVVIFAAVSG